MADYYKPLSQADIEEELMRLSALLEEATDDYAILAEDEAKKAARHKSAWATAYIREEGAVKYRESMADYKTEDSLYDMKIAEALTKAKREKMLSLRSSMDALRTLAANVRAQT